VSLLLDALKRAEQEKLAKQGERPATEPERARTRASQAPAAPSLELAPIHAAPAGGASAPAPARSDAAAAQQLFQAKTAANDGNGKKNLILWGVIATVVLVVAGAGIYVWSSIQSFTPRIAASARPRPAAAPTAAPAASAASEAALRLDPFVPQLAQRSDPVVETPKRTTPAPVHAAPAEDLATSLLKSAAPSAAAPLKLAPSQERPRVPNDVAAGYDALRAGDLPTARRSYALALTSDAASIDAQLGMATVEARLGNRAAAASHYRRALDVDPRNATALAGLASLADYSRPDGLEAQLRSDVARYPQSAALRFTLGNLYASQSRWQDAQAEYFEAYRNEPASADISYNLAVALDHLGQSRLAADFYHRALEAARGQATQFDPAPVARRLAELGR
jgi:tetratricopeptide (TPR) repeat protein